MQTTHAEAEFNFCPLIDNFLAQKFIFFKYLHSRKISFFIAKIQSSDFSDKNFNFATVCKDAGFKALLNSSCSGQSHGSRILQIRHDNCRDGKHKTRHDLLGIVVQFRVGERDAGTVNGHPGCPLQTQHQGTHAEDHPQNVHVVRYQVVIGIGRTAIGVATSIGIRYCLRQN